MKKTIEIKGMMCGHCEAAVKKALEALPEVAQAFWESMQCTPCYFPRFILCRTTEPDSALRTIAYIQTGIGMMCGHCEAAVKKALEALPEVAQAEVSHEKGTAVVTLQAEVADDALKKAVEEKDYEVVSVQ